MKEVTDEDDLMIINKSGITIRMSVSNLRVMGRATQGVRLIKLGESDEISSVAKVRKIEEVEEIEIVEGATGEGTASGGPDDLDEKNEVE